MSGEVLQETGEFDISVELLEELWQIGAEVLDEIDTDKEALLRHPREECGIVAVISPEGIDAIPHAKTGALALKHRGNQGAGIAYLVQDDRVNGKQTNSQIFASKESGKVSIVLNNMMKGAHQSRMALGQTIYATYPRLTEDERWHALQPAMPRDTRRETKFALIHNGHINNADYVATGYGLKPSDSFSDSDLVTQVIHHVSHKNGLSTKEALMEVLPKLKGAFSIVVMDSENDKIYAARDRMGIRPMVYGVTPDGSQVVTSETIALESMEGQARREISPGELLEISLDGKLHSQRFIDRSEVNRKHCVLEAVYFSHPDSYYLNGDDRILIDDMRQQSGRQLALAEDDDFYADLVLPVPDSGKSAAEGYLDELIKRLPNIRLVDGIRKIEDERSFMEDGQDARRAAAERKYQLRTGRNSVRGLDVVLVDDSVIRGTTTEVLVEKLRAKGVGQIHLRIALPPVTHPCFYGVNLAHTDELIANLVEDQEALRVKLGVDSVSYIGLDELQQAIDDAAETQPGLEEPNPSSNFDYACLDGNYPEPVPVKILRKAGVVVGAD